MILLFDVLIILFIFLVAKPDVSTSTVATTTTVKAGGMLSLKWQLGTDYDVHSLIIHSTFSERHYYTRVQRSMFVKRGRFKIPTKFWAIKMQTLKTAVQLYARLRLNVMRSILLSGRWEMRVDWTKLLATLDRIPGRATVSIASAKVNGCFHSGIAFLPRDTICMHVRVYVCTLCCILSNIESIFRQAEHVDVSLNSEHNCNNDNNKYWYVYASGRAGMRVLSQ